MKITDLQILIIDMGREFSFPAHGSFRAQGGLKTGDKE